MREFARVLLPESAQQAVVFSAMGQRMVSRVGQGFPEVAPSKAGFVDI